MRSALLLLLSAAFATNSVATSLERVSVQLQWKHQYEFAGFYAAKHKGFYAEAGLDVELREYRAGVQIVDDVLQGKSTFGTYYSTIIKECMNRRPLVLLAAYFKQSPLVIATSPDIFSPEDLKGKRVMAQPDEMESANFHTMFSRFNVDPKTLKLVPHSFTIDAFAAGDVDAMTVFTTNETYFLHKQGVRFNILDPRNYGVPLYDLNLFTTKAYANRNPRRVRDFIAATNRGWEYALSHTDEIVDLILEDYNSLDKTRSQLLFEAHQTYAVMLPEIYPLGSIDPRRLMEIQNLFVATGLAAESVAPREFLFAFDSGGDPETESRNGTGSRNGTRSPPPNEPDLTEDALEYLDARDWRLRYCFSPVWFPFDYLQDEQHRGIFKDFLDLFAEKLQIDFVPIASKTWGESLELAKARRCDLISGAVRTRERESYLAFTSPYYQLNHVLIAREDKPFVTDFERIAQHAIAVPKNTAITTRLKQQYPGTNFIEIESPADLTRLLDSGEAYAGVTVLEHAAQIIDRSIRRYRIIGTLEEPYPISVAVRNDHPRLLTIMQALVDSVTQAERDAIGNRRTKFTIHKTVDYSLVWQVLGAAAIVLLVLLHRHYELARVNRRLEQAKRAADAANRAKDRFLTYMSHEVRTPLNAVLNFAQLGRDHLDPQRSRDYFDMIGSAGRSLLHIINQILDFAKIESGILEAERVPFDLRALLDGTLRMVAPTERSDGPRLSLELEPNLPTLLLGDPKKLEQILVNLLGNAVKFTPAGEVLLEVRRGSPEAPAAEEEAREPTGDRLRFCVEDTGIGLTARQLERLFIPYRQADRSTGRIYGGTGLGLVISKRLVEIMGGALEVHSVYGQGSRFCFTVPLAIAEAGSAALTDTTPSSPGRPCPRSDTTASGTILVVEDNRFNQRVARDLLESMGLECDIAAQGEEALTKLNARPRGYALVLMDVLMPIMDGLLATARIRSDPRYTDLPIIALTAHAQPGERARCLAAGMNDYIAKPIDRRVFQTTVDRWLPGRRAVRGDPGPRPTETPRTSWLKNFDTGLGIDRVGGDEAFYREMLLDFYAGYRDEIGLLEPRALHDATGREPLRRMAHNLKSMAASLGAVPLSERAARLEAEFDREAGPDPTTLTHLRDALDQALEELRLHFPPATPPPPTPR